MKATLALVLALLAMAVTSSAAELPSAPSSVAKADTSAVEFIAPASTPRTSKQPKLAENRIVDPKFVALAIMSTGTTFADSYTTLFARQNWLAGKKGVCNVEVQSAYLYGTHPTVGRAYAVASAKSVGSIMASYYLRKHHNKLWSFPLIVNSVLSAQGTTQNMIACN